MSKRAPSIGRIAAMAGFSLSCVAILLFLWLSFGGAVPLRPEGYRFEAAIPEAATLAQEADVRLAGVNVGRVKSKRLDAGGARTVVEIEMDERYAPVALDSRVVLRQKTLLGETYVEITPGDRRAGTLPDGGRLAAASVRPTVELDEIFSAFDRPTRRAFQVWVAELARTIEGRSEHLNDALGNLEPFAADGAALLATLDEQERAVTGLVRNTGRVFGAINDREGALRRLIRESHRAFGELARRDDALARVIETFPTFLRESRATVDRLRTFAERTRPLVRELQGPAGELEPAVRELGRLAPELDRLFATLPVLERASRESLPGLERTLEGAGPVVEQLHPFLAELNPVLSYLAFHQATVAGFISNASSNLAAAPGGERIQTNAGIIEGRSFENIAELPDWDRGNAYLAPNALLRAPARGGFEGFHCAGGREELEPDDAIGGSPGDRRPPCLLAPPSLYDGRIVPRLARGEAPSRPAPRGVEGTRAVESRGR